VNVTKAMNQINEKDPDFGLYRHYVPFMERFAGRIHKNNLVWRDVELAGPCWHSKVVGTKQVDASASSSAGRRMKKKEVYVVFAGGCTIVT